MNTSSMKQQSAEQQQAPQSYKPTEENIQPIPGYRFIRELGHGSQGQILLAERESDGLQVAIKKLNIGSVKTWKEYELFHREAETLASLDIDGVAHFYEAIERLEDKPPCSYLVQEYIHGKSLGDMIKSGHRFSFDVVYDILIQIVTILQQLHTHNPPVIHRDIKPSNIMLKRQEDGDWYKVYLIDFGAVANPQVQGGGSTVAGTYGYMPPEQLMGKPEPASDIYAMAAVAVHLISGRSPAEMSTKDFRLIFEPDMQNMPPAVVNALRSMLEPDPQKRLSDYEEIRNLLRSFQLDKYDYNVSRKKALSPEEFNSKLENVHYYGEAGNIELWQELSDNLPRNNVPSCYSFPFYLNYDLNSNGRAVFNRSSFEYSPLKITEKSYLPFFVVLISLVLIAISGMYFGLNISSLNLFLFIFFIFFIAFSCIFIVYKLISRKKRISMPSTIHDDFQNCQMDMEELLINGRKTIATIVSIKYLSPPHYYTEQNLWMPSMPPFKTIRSRFACHMAPFFCISYKFNPPDDEKKEDLVHSIITTIEPENHYKVGDPFPILYRIYHLSMSDNQKGYVEREFVDSMPFPLPANSIVGSSGILYHEPATWRSQRE